MKKVIVLLLVSVLVLSLCACGNTGNAGETTQPQAQGLQVGYARESILPDGQVNMSGSGNQEHRISTGYLDILYATCTAFTEGDTTVLLYSTDTLTAKWGWTNEARQLISQATGVPETHIQIGATHSHSGPAVGGNEPLVMQWKPIYMNALVNSAKAALADRAPAKMYGKKVMTENQNFVRHYLMNDGTYSGSNFGDTSSGYKEHATEADREMILVKLDREGDKKDILMMNFQAHPCFVPGTELSADYIGEVRNIIEKETGMQFIYFLGAAGNHNATSHLPGEDAGKTKQAYGKSLAQWALDVIDEINTPIEGTGIKCAEKVVTYPSNNYGQDRLADAQKVTAMFRADGNASKATAYAKTLGFWSVYECNGIVQCAGLDPTGDMKMNVVRIGGLGFVAAPYEMFSNSSMYIKENAPNEFTVISTVTNGYDNYIPSEAAYEYGCYESYTARYASGTAEKAAEEFVNMLKDIQ